MKNKKSTNLSRLHTIDLFRGFAVLSMIAYHFVFDLKYIFNVNIPWFESYGAYLWQQSICIVFIFVSGISFTFSKNNIKRGFIILILGILFSLGTYLIIPEQFIVFGILHFLGISCIITAILFPLLKKIPAHIGFLIFILLFLIFKGINDGYVGFADISLYKLPQSIYDVPFLSIVGFPNDSFFSADYYPIFPWLFLYWSGIFAWFCISPRVKQAPVCRIKIPFINFFGRHALIVYILHQPICYGLIYLFFKLIIGR